MYWLIRILSFVGMVALGWAGLGLLFTFGPTFHDRLSEENFAIYTRAFLVGAPAMLILGSLIGVGSFFAQGKRYLVLVIMPCALPVLYLTGVMAYFTAFG